MRSMFCCPVCGEPLEKEEKRLVCPCGHSFDKAKEGYVNLLTGKSGGNHGDNKEMIRARRMFLAKGAYEPLRQALVKEVSENAPGTLLDCGCGEGYYTKKLEETVKNCKTAAVDISKIALSYGAKSLSFTETAVASVYNLPLKKESVEALTLLFSPYAEEEILRVLKKEGHFYMAIPGKRHLFGLKKLLYDTPYENEVADFSLPSFRLLREEHLFYEKTFEKEEVSDLFKMTPYYYRTPEEGKERIFSCERLKSEIEFHLLHYQKVKET